MKPSFDFQLVLLEKIKFEGTDVMSFRFSQILDKLEKYQVPPLFEYTAGQYAYFNLGDVVGDPRGPTRHFTVSSSPTENFMMLSTKIRESPYKQRLSILEVGDRVYVSGPEGEFVLPEDYSKPLIFLSGGIGVTPFRSMINYATDKQLPLKIIMFDSNKNQQNILFKKEFDDWTSLNKNLQIIYTLSDDNSNENNVSTTEEWKGEKGRVDKEMILKYVDKNTLNDAIFYISGPPDMLKSMQLLLEKELEIPKERIKVEEFTGY
ncbi:FAD-dependent oxidoreductase [Candidatus Nitrosocosmicus arcticus]|uniref:Flavodoxin reductase (Ferredoxin-NADPH reductase) n=1 Tax=Candidatus Nitrosocosmicus arcticus TaxID=2035267 RepID=A0A557SXE6_9ARCH|nr:FAD-dependent oxidoreductase [Candidatus Nitrosocosmicus arcticus]TVP41276.1 Flavodoxin reductase (ferredoxin-NADPH reductase) [Candidatus Nitrosocosmicus arcticus]